MKNYVRFLCVILALSLAIPLPVYAADDAASRGSAFFSSYLAFIQKISSTGMQIWYDVDSNAAIMDEIGVSSIELYESADQQSWTKVRTYEMEDYSSMIDRNTSSHTGHLSYSKGKTGYYYYAHITFYAKNNTGIGIRFLYTDILQM